MNVSEVTTNAGSPYDNATEMKTHTGVIHHISRHLDIPEETVTRLYEIVLKRYKTKARIKDFLVILVERRVEDLLRKRKERSCP